MKRNKSIILILLFFLSITNSFCQILTGIVYDENNNPMIGASVYLDGTTIGTSTDNNGIYSLTLNDRINTFLVISFVGYETQIIYDPFEKTDLEIKLAPKVIKIKEVTVSTIRLSREKKLKLFREEFLGETRAGRSCKIKNEDDIIFSIDDKTNTLFVSCDKPILIENPYLGYSVEMNLMSFYIKFNRKNFNSNNVSISFYLGTTLFTDVGNNVKYILKRRENSYIGSEMHFFRNFYNNYWGEEVFSLYRGRSKVNPKDYFSISDTLTLKKVRVLKNMSNNESEPFFCTFNLLYNNVAESKVIFRGNSFLIDKFGNDSSADLILFSGEIGNKRVGDLLPVDYKVNSLQHTLK